MDDASAQFDEALEGVREVGDAEVRKREAIARTAATLMQPKRRVSRVGLEALAFVLPSLVERDVEQRLPEAPGRGPGRQQGTRSDQVASAVDDTASSPSAKRASTRAIFFETPQERLTVCRRPERIAAAG